MTAHDVLEKVKLDPSRSLYAFHVASVSVLSLWCAFLFDLDNAWYGLLTVPFVIQMNAGATVWRAGARLGGTVIGAVVGLAFVAVFAQSPFWSFVTSALWLFAIGTWARFEAGADPYAYAMAGLTAYLVVLISGPTGSIAFQQALDRTTEALFPIVLAFMVTLVVFPVSVTGALRGGVVDARAKVLTLVRDTLAGDGVPPVEERRAAVAALGAAYNLLRTLRLERDHRAPDLAKLSAVLRELNRLLVAEATLAFALTGYAETGQPPGVVAVRTLLLEIVDDLPPELRDAGQVRGAMRRLARLRSEGGPLGRGAPFNAADDPDEPDPAVAYAMHRFAEILEGYLAAVTTWLDPAAPSPPKGPVVERYPDWSAAFQRGARPAIMCLALGLLWISTASSNLATITSIVPVVGLLVPTLAPRAFFLPFGPAFGMGYASMFVPVLVLQALLPLVDGFAGFALLVGSLLFTFFYVCTGRPGLLPVAYSATILLALTLQPSNAQVYSGLGVFNTVASLALLPARVAATFSIIFPENQAWLARRLRAGSTRLLRRAAAGGEGAGDRFLAQALDVVGDYGGDLSLDEPRHRALLERGLAVVPTGAELARLRRLQRSGALPPVLEGAVDGIVDAVLARSVAIETGDGPVATPVLDHAIDTARSEAIALADRSGDRAPDRLDALRIAHEFLATAEFLRFVSRTRRLALPA